MPGNYFCKKCYKSITKILNLCNKIEKYCKIKPNSIKYKYVNCK